MRAPAPQTRVVHCKRAPYDVYIGRGQGSVWGNPFSFKPGTPRVRRLSGCRGPLGKLVNMPDVWHGAH